MSTKRTLPIHRGGARKLFFPLLEGANHTNLYKNLIKFKISNVNLGTIGGQAPVRPPGYAPAHPLMFLGSVGLDGEAEGPNPSDLKRNMGVQVGWAWWWAVKDIWWRGMGRGRRMMEWF